MDSADTEAIQFIIWNKTVFYGTTFNSGCTSSVK